MKYRIPKKIALLMVAFLVSVLLWYVLLYLPKMNKLKGIKQEIKSIQTQSKLVSSNISSAPSKLKLANEVIILRKYDEIKTKMPKKGAITSVLSPICKLGQEKNIRIISIKPLTYQLFEKDKSQEESHLEGIPINISLEGRFIDIGQYLFDLSMLPFFGGYKNIQMDMSEKIYPKIEAKITCILLFF